MLEVVTTDRAPVPVGPYSQAIKVEGKFLFLSGQIPLDPATGKLVEGDIGTQTEQVMANIRAVLAAAGSSLEQIVKTTIFLVDMADFGQVNQVYGKYFSERPPARSCIQVAALPLGARIEIECIAMI
ncbi:MAG: RidA family protein [Pseudanabaenaceae cyanobacterium SKYGB_i_bin29]|nr:RidA family protein [Pseudanabaenaceae cyanobacterium SKYG29]MDW8421312.1 RidA family protein [Pseudanabaenaceae cyanobacterium SKYGB_i_bin29]